MSCRSTLVVISTLCLVVVSNVASADQLTAMIENDLAALGYDTGNVDGEADMRTAIAISQFQAAKGLEVTGEVSAELAVILANEVESGSATQNAPTTTAATTSTASSEQACLQQKIAAAEQQQASKKKGLGGMFSSLSKTVAKYGNNEIAEISSDVYEASATVNDLAAAARDLGVTESEIEECTGASFSSQVATASPAGNGGATVPATQNPASVPATPTTVPVVQESTYARRSAFTTAAQQLPTYDLSVESCQGSREGYRSQFDSLVSVAHPDYRTEAMSLYDNQYSQWKQMVGGLAEGTTMLGPCSKIEEFKATANGMLDRLGANCAAASQCASLSKAVEISAPDKDSGTVTSQAPKPKPAAYEAAISRAKTHSEKCKQIGKQYEFSMADYTSRGNVNSALTVSERERKNANLNIANDCVSRCTRAWQALDSAKPGQAIESFNSYVVACEDSYVSAAAL